MKNHRYIILFVVAVVLVAFCIFRSRLSMEETIPSRQESVQISWVTLTGTRAGNDRLTYLFKNTTDKTVVFYPELYRISCGFSGCKDNRQYPVQPRYTWHSTRFMKKWGPDLHAVRLQRGESGRYTKEGKKPNGELCFYESLKNVKTMTLKVEFTDCRNIKNYSNLPPEIYTNDICGEIKMDVTIDSDTLSAEPARKDADESVR